MLDEEFNRIKKGEDNVPPDLMVKLVTAGLVEEEAIRERLVETLAAKGVDLSALDFINAHSVPPAPVLDPEWTPFLRAMSLTNIYGQMSLIYKRIEAVQLVMTLLTQSCKIHTLRAENKFFFKKSRW